MRLIDVDVLIAELCKIEAKMAKVGIKFVAGEHNLYKIIKKQPTVYDVDKVVEKLKEKSFEVSTGYYFCNCIEYDDTIDIVKQGGIDG